ncbi:hypothetical protein B7463_g3397, partial [Scytalidium lignicola]
MTSTQFTYLTIFALFNTLSLTIPLRDDHPSSFEPTHLTPTSRYSRLTKLKPSADSDPLTASSYPTTIRPTNGDTQLVIEVSFNNVPRYLLLDTGSADTWMISSDFQCLNSNFSSVPTSECSLGEPYTGPKISQIGNETLFQSYGTGEVVTGPFGYADVSIAGLTVKDQKVALVDRGYVLGDKVRSGVVGVAPHTVAQLFENTNSTTAAPNGTVTPYQTVFENMYSSKAHGGDRIAPFFSLALERGDAGGYIAFGGLPPVNFTRDFIFTPFTGMNYYGHHDSGRYYPIQPQGFELNGAKETTEYRAIVDSGTAANRLPKDIADKVNAAFNPPAVYDASLDLYITACNATTPSFSFTIGDKSFPMNPKDMFLAVSYNNLCATSFTSGLPVGGGAYPEGFYILGDAFLNSLVAVFDVGAISNSQNLHPLKSLAKPSHHQPSQLIKMIEPSMKALASRFNCEKMIWLRPAPSSGDELSEEEVRPHESTSPKEEVIISIPTNYAKGDF